MDRFVFKGWTIGNGDTETRFFSWYRFGLFFEKDKVITAINQWYFKQLDVNNAFLHGDLNEEVYMTLLQGMQVAKPRQCASDHSLFLKHGYKTITALLVYVDDIVLSGNDLAEIQSITQLLDNAFKIKDLGDPRYLKGTPGVGISFSVASNIHLKGFSDLDWAGCIDTKRSIIGYAIYIGDSFISWKSKKQAIVSKSSS
ncbi:uncharacterized protein LOC114373253 [Glycine soja]|uniref:uncharacterized protein LOC114373253 n=1 Tax=Glycine soja TaxID=3848 RepID=UPI00103A7C02|nr:uncharacterized protein LOC114373253 [Glycine soja]